MAAWPVEDKHGHMMRIEIETASGSRWSFPLRVERVTIGRSQDNDICLPDQWLSRHHAEIRRRDDAHALIDLKSRNGSFVNEKRVLEDLLLRLGDVIRLGEHRLRYLKDAPVAATMDQPPAQDFVPPGTRIFSTTELRCPTTQPSTPEEAPGRSHPIGLIAEAASVLLVEHRPLPEIFERILTLLMGAVPADRGAILLLEGDPPAPVIKASRSRSGKPIQRISQSIVRKVVEERVALFLPDLMADAAFKSQDSIVFTGLRSSLCAPLWFRSPTAEKDAVIGLVYLDQSVHEKPLQESDVPIVSALANIAAAKIENVRLLEESIEKRRLEEDIRIAADVQRSLLPHGSPHIDGYDLVGSTNPCHAVGGDYYDLLAHDGRLILVLGDVSGKGRARRCS
jgi:sigma-B regulation protein RsbU (phosphoserine phosphatase)